MKSIIKEKFGYTFKNKHLLVQACTRPSYSAQFNLEMLEWIGDSVLNFYVSKVLIKKFGYLCSESEDFKPVHGENYFCVKSLHSEKEFTDCRKEIIKNETLAKKAEELGLLPYIRLSEGDLKNGVLEQIKPRADVIEAILGAIAIDCDWNPNILQNAVTRMIDADIFLSDIALEPVAPSFTLDTAISVLKELADDGGCSVPLYDTPIIGLHGPNGTTLWPCICKVESWGIEKKAIASTKQEAKRNATYAVLCARFGDPAKK